MRGSNQYTVNCNGCIYFITHRKEGKKICILGKCNKYCKYKKVKELKNMEKEIYGDKDLIPVLEELKKEKAAEKKPKEGEKK